MLASSECKIIILQIADLYNAGTNVAAAAQAVRRSEQHMANESPQTELSMSPHDTNRLIPPRAAHVIAQHRRRRCGSEEIPKVGRGRASRRRASSCR